MFSVEDINIPEIKKSARLHPKIINILFENKKEVLRKLSDLRNLHYVDHISINIINPNNEIAIFSITPSVEFNLIIHDLWKFDDSFYPKVSQNNSFFWWDDGYDQSFFNALKKMKETEHNFLLGLSLVRKLADIRLVYSFATRSQNHNMRKYYLENMQELFRLGDYGYKLIENIYLKYSSVFTSGNEVRNKEIIPRGAPNLKLVKNHN